MTMILGLWHQWIPCFVQTVVVSRTLPPHQETSLMFLKHVSTIVKRTVTLELCPWGWGHGSACYISRRIELKCFTVDKRQGMALCAWNPSTVKLIQDQWESLSQREQTEITIQDTQHLLPLDTCTWILYVFGLLGWRLGMHMPLMYVVCLLLHPRPCLLLCHLVRNTLFRRSCPCGFTGEPCGWDDKQLSISDLLGKHHQGDKLKDFCVSRQYLPGFST